MRVEGGEQDRGGDVLLLSWILYGLYGIQESVPSEARALGRNVPRP
jgi:hypothetical protein